MPYFAQLDENNAIVFVDSLQPEDCLNSYGQVDESAAIQKLKEEHGSNTVWRQMDANSDGTVPGKGYVYHEDLGKFVSPQWFPGWTLNKETLSWEPPHPAPTDLTTKQLNDGYVYQWNVEQNDWAVGRLPSSYDGTNAPEDP